MFIQLCKTSEQAKIIKIQLPLYNFFFVFHFMSLLLPLSTVHRWRLETVMDAQSMCTTMCGIAPFYSKMGLWNG